MRCGIKTFKQKSEPYEYTKNHLVHFKMVNFKACELYLKKFFKYSAYKKHHKNFTYLLLFTLNLPQLLNFPFTTYGQFKEKILNDNLLVRKLRTAFFFFF